MLVGGPAKAAFALELLEGPEREDDIEVFVDVPRVDVEVGSRAPLSPVLGRWQLVRLVVENRVRIEREAPDSAGRSRYTVTVEQSS